MYDIIIIGAGASGLIAALDLSNAGKKVRILEAKENIGGRILDVNDPAFKTTVELGAEFVHGDLELTKDLLKKAGGKLYERKGEIFKFENGKIQPSEFVEDYSILTEKFKALTHDISVRDFIREYLSEPKHETVRESLKKYVEGYYAADLNRVSTFALRNEFENSSDKQFATESGYSIILQYLKDELKKNGCDIYPSSPVTEIVWKENDVAVHTTQKVYSSEQVLITVSIGVLQSEKIKFTPAIQTKTDAAKQLGFGHVVKLIIQFKKPFWEEDHKLKKMSFLFSEEQIPTWWTTYPKKESCLVGWLGGPDALKFKESTDQEILEAAIFSLSRIFKLDIIDLKKLIVTSHSFNWSNDPYTCGAYSFDVVDGYKYKQIIREPIEQTIFFAGEGLYDGPEIGTVEAALKTGKFAAQQILKNEGAIK